MKKPAIHIALLLASCVLAPIPLRAEDPATPPPPAAPGFDASPAAVRSAILKAAGSGRVEKVRAVRRGERTLYLADIDLEGDYDLKLQLLASGEITRRTEEMAVDALPTPVKEALASLAGKTGRIEEAKQITEGKTTVFKAEIDWVDKPELDVTVSPEGVVLERKEEKD